MKEFAYLLMLLLLFVLTACDEDSPTGPKPPAETDRVTENIKDAGVFFSMAQMTTVSTFDLKFTNESRSVGVYLNGGVSGSAGVTAKNLGVVDFNAAANLDTGFVADAESTAVIGEGWYNYDFMTHTLSSKGEVYLVHAVDYEYYKMKINAFDSSYTISYALCAKDGTPTSTQIATIPAEQGAPGYFSLAQGSIIENNEWDVAFLTIPLYIPEMGATIQNPGMRINSAAGVEIAIVENKEYDSITSVPGGLSYLLDEGESLAVGDRLFDYNPENHRLTPPDVVYIVKTANGKHAKLQVTAYYHPETGESGYVNFKAEMLD